MTSRAAPSTAASNVRLVLDAASLRARTLETAIELATATGRHLEVIVVENEDLMRLGTLPVAMEVSGLFGGKRGFDAAEAARMVRVQATGIRRHLDRAAGRRAFDFSVAIVRGRALDDAVVLAENAALVLVGSTLPALYEHRPVALRQRPAARRIGVIYAPSAAGDRLLSAALQPARELNAHLDVLFTTTAAMSAAAVAAVRSHATPAGVTCRALDPAELRRLAPATCLMLMVNQDLVIPGIGNIAELSRLAEPPMAIVA